MPYCWNCGRIFHSMGIANHRRAHQRRGEEVTISLADGVWTYRPDPGTEHDKPPALTPTTGKLGRHDTPTTEEQ